MYVAGVGGLDPTSPIEPELLRRIQDLVAAGDESSAVCTGRPRAPALRLPLVRRRTWRARPRNSMLPGVLSAGDRNGCERGPRSRRSRGPGEHVAAERVSDQPGECRKSLSYVRNHPGRSHWAGCRPPYHPACMTDALKPYRPPSVQCIKRALGSFQSLQRSRAGRCMGQ
jgi:hypothetical protein